MSAHGAEMRGMRSAVVDPGHEGRFGLMFKGLPAAKYGNTDQEIHDNLTALGVAMQAGKDLPKDGADPEESGIPALYTYFGQFIDHDLTLGPEGSFQKIKDPAAVIDFRTPAFDLDCVYGRGPDDQPFLYNGHKFLLGAKLEGGSGEAWDLPRNNADPARALIGDPRNDENTIVSQLQGLFLRFHNRLVDERKMSFEQAQVETQRHYQYVVLNDFLARVVTGHVLDALKTNGEFDESKIEYFHWRKHHKYPFMPIEFSTAAYRFGHSMIRPGYRLNDANLLPIFSLDGPAFDLRGKHAMYADRGIDWATFVDTEVRLFDGVGDTPEEVLKRKHRLQFAYKIDTSLVDPLSNLPLVVAGNPPPSLAQRNLLRSVSFGLPSGQIVADRMGVPRIHDEKILLGKATTDPDDIKAQKPITDVSKVFAGNCPLWTYILAEAMQYKAKMPVEGSPDGFILTPQLGPVGGRMVAEVFVGLMFADSKSILGKERDPNWKPMVEGFKLKDFVKYAAPKFARPATRSAGA